MSNLKEDMKSIGFDLDADQLTEHSLAFCDHVNMELIPTLTVLGMCGYPVTADQAVKNVIDSLASYSKAINVLSMILKRHGLLKEQPNLSLSDLHVNACVIQKNGSWGLLDPGTNKGERNGN